MKFDRKWCWKLQTKKKSWERWNTRLGYFWMTLRFTHRGFVFKQFSFLFFYFYVHSGSKATVVIYKFKTCQILVFWNSSFFYCECWDRSTVTNRHFVTIFIFSHYISYFFNKLNLYLVWFIWKLFSVFHPRETIIFLWMKRKCSHTRS